MNNVLSIDFDYWLEIPNFNDLDWGFMEAPFFIEDVWGIRASDSVARGEDLRERCKIAAGEPVPGKFFRLLCDRNITIQKSKVAISESHAVAYNWFRHFKDLHIINVDAHHDLGYSSSSELGCDNWLMLLAREGKVSKITQIYPKWRLHQMEWGRENSTIKKELKELNVELEVYYGVDDHLPRDIRMKKAFICRSGAWVPPWLDDDFNDLVRGFLGGHSSIAFYGRPGTGFDSMVRHLDWDEIEKRGEEQKAIIEKLQASPVGS